MAFDDSFTTKFIEAISSFGVTLVANGERSLTVEVSIATTLLPLKPDEPSEE